MTRLELVRRIRGLSLRELGDLSGVWFTSISNAEQGNRVYPAHRRRLAEALDCDVDELFDDSGHALRVDSEAVLAALLGRRTA